MQDFNEKCVKKFSEQLFKKLAYRLSDVNALLLHTVFP